MSFTSYIKSLGKLSAEAEKELVTAFQKKELRKGDLLFQQEEVCHHIFYIEEGLARTYYDSKNGKEITAWFSSENSFITAIDSFYQHKPTRYSCELLEDSVIYSIRYTDMETMLNEVREAGKIAFYVTYEIARKMSEFIASIKFNTAEERYNILLQDHPAIFQRAQLGHIASYLGITQETLSRIRAAK